MKPRIKDYLKYTEELSIDKFISRDSFKKLTKLKKEYGDLTSDYQVYEISLKENDMFFDVAFKTDYDDKLSSSIWYEFDEERYSLGDINPCVFIDAEKLNDRENEDEYINITLKDFLKDELTPVLQTKFIEVVNLYKEIGLKFFVVGTMSARKEGDSFIRIANNLDSLDKCLLLLERLNWAGNIKILREKLEKWNGLHSGKFIFNIDIYEDHIADKVGIEIYMKNKFTINLKPWVNYIVENGYCDSSVGEELIKWNDMPPHNNPFIQNAISHFKASFVKEDFQKMKVYLMQTCSPVHNFDMYHNPVSMNLELTSKCPLKCPQCYLNLEHGKDMPKEVAFHWIDEAKKENVEEMCLSGGETYLYPYLFDVVKKLKEVQIKSNVAFSGFGITKEYLKKLIESGVDNIFISLNGSTKKINDLTRDAYDLAINSLKLLKELKFKNTYINWVMHDNNADDFPNMIKLSEEYNVKKLVVLAFKPDNKNQLKSLPSFTQMKSVVDFIRNYKGNVVIEVEGCYSPLRALLYNSFFGNRNVGAGKGCNALRNSLSISLDGKPTPCRHLMIEEDFDNIRDYWNNSKYANKLRNLENNMEDPCKSCTLNNNCLPCMATSYILRNKLVMGHEECPVKEIKG